MKHLNILFFTFLLLFNSPIFAGGALMVSPPDCYWHPSTHASKYARPLPADADLFMVRLLSEKATVTIDNGKANIDIEQVFKNSSSKDTLEQNFFLMPAPIDQKYESFTVLVNGEKQRAELINTQKVHKVYEDLVRRTQNTTFLQYRPQHLYKVRVKTILPNAKQTIKVSYKQNLPLENNTYSYTYPASIQQFYPAIDEFEVKVNVKDKNKIKHVFMPNSQGELMRKSDQEVVVSKSYKKAKMKEDFSFHYSTSEQAVGYTLYTYKEPKEDGFFWLTFDQGLEKEIEKTPQDVSFVIETSEYMDDKKLAATKKAITDCLNTLGEEDRFNVICFADEAKGVFEDLQVATDANKTKAKDFISGLSAEGETNIEAAIAQLLAQKSKHDRPHNVLFISASEATEGEDDEDKLVDKLKLGRAANMHLHTIGVGDEANTYLLDMMAIRNKGTRHYTTKAKSIGTTIANAYATISHPILNKVQLHIGEESQAQIEEIYPNIKSISAFYKDQPLTIVGRYKKGGKSSVSLIGETQDKKVTRYRYECDFATDNQSHTFVPRIWAARRIGHLLSEMRIDLEEDEMVEEVVLLSKKYGIVNPYTGHLVTKAEKDAKIDLPKAAIHDKANYKADYTVLMEDISGEQSMTASQEIQSLLTATTLNDLKQGHDRMAKKDKEGKVLDDNVQGQYQMIDGKIVYQTAKAQWVVPAIAKSKQKATVIEFGSLEYFDLVGKEPKASSFLTLGKEVQFMVDQQVYDIRLDGGETTAEVEKIEGAEVKATDKVNKTEKEELPAAKEKKMEELEEGNAGSKAVVKAK